MAYNGKVRYFDCDADGDETERGVAWLDEVLERDDPEYVAAEHALRDTGRYWIGGGAAPLVLLIAA